MIAAEKMNKQASTTRKEGAGAGAGAGAGDNSATGIKNKTKFEPTESQRVIGSDTFSYYSNKLHLTKALQCKEDAEQVIQSTSIMTSAQGPVMKRRKGSTAYPVRVQDGGIRKTRISFEGHPSLFMYEDIITMFERMNCADISDDDEEEESSEKISDDAAIKDEKKRPGVSPQQHHRLVH